MQAMDRNNGSRCRDLLLAENLAHRALGLAWRDNSCPVKADAKLEARKRSQLDRLYQRVIDDLDALVRAVGLKAA
jgi:hypothetical protein